MEINHLKPTFHPSPSHPFPQKTTPPFSQLRVVSKPALQDFFIDTCGEDSVKLTLPECMSVWGGVVPQVRVELYSVNAGSWKEIPFPKEIPYVDLINLFRCVFVDSGVFYFQGKKEIMSFDLHNEVFAMYQYPDSGERMSDVLDFDGSIAVIMKSGKMGSVLSLWTFDDIGGNFSWTKKFNIDPDLKIDYVHLYLGDGLFLAQDYGVGYFFYNDKKKENKKLVSSEKVR
ncbi:hypothetical protein POM88_001979 [Heracleum sosnowskyi]|uniref:F-box associated beta-propeller type 3 domain-containing protein n=1 Tax=Heracleum sosnowskyi TaxID=360622 RepID=A0AAD8JFA4_9APIA|nr:hypothetical protein POM88_001979 [Heracleum sosnowskyi]